MTTLNRVVLAWSGPNVVGSAVTVLHYSASDNVAPPVAAIKTAFSGNAGLFPPNTVITVPNSGDVIDDRTGGLVGVWNASGAGTVTGSGGPGAAAGVGLCIGWSTGGIVSGKRGPRKLRGRTFLVPISRDFFDVDGTVNPGALTYAANIANGLQGAGPLAVWHRPTSLAAADGNSYGVISNRVRDKVAFLSSRRD